MFRNNKFFRWLIILISPLGLLLLMGLFLVNYDASHIFILSIIVGILLQIIIIILKKIYSSRRVKIISFSLLILVILFFYISVSNLTSLLYVRSDPSGIILLEVCVSYLDNYRLIVNYPNNNFKKLEIEEEVIPNQKTQIQFSKKENIPINSKGSFVNQVTIEPLTIIYDEPNFAKYKPPDCEDRQRIYDVKDTNKDKAIVELKGFPAGSFYKADNANILTPPNTNLFTGHESIQLTIGNLHEPIIFTFFSFPYYYLRTFLEPLLSFANLNKWIIVYLGTIIGIVFNPKLRPIINIAAEGINFMSQHSSRIINTNGGNYNESIGSNYIQGDHINTNQNSSKAVPQIEESIDRDNALTSPIPGKAVSGTNQPQTPVPNHIVCTNCGHNNLANLNFCNKCGTPLTKPHI